MGWILVHANMFNAAAPSMMDPIQRTPQEMLHYVSLYAPHECSLTKWHLQFFISTLEKNVIKSQFCVYLWNEESRKPGFELVNPIPNYAIVGVTLISYFWVWPMCINYIPEILKD